MNMTQIKVRGCRQREKLGCKATVRECMGGLHWSKAELQSSWSDLLTLRIISASDYEVSSCSHAYLHNLQHHISLDVWWWGIQRMEWQGSMSESGHLSCILGMCSAYQRLSLSPLLKDWKNFSIVHGPPTFFLLSLELLYDWVRLDEGRVYSRPGHRKHENFSLCCEPCSCFSPDAFDTLRRDLPVPSTLTHVKLWLRKNMFMFP